MNQLATKNLFSQQDIKLASMLFFKAFHLEEKNPAQGMKARQNTLQFFIDSINSLLANRLVPDKHERLALIDLLDKLITQKEAFQLMLMSETELENLKKTSQNFARKTKFSSPQLQPVNG